MARINKKLLFLDGIFDGGLTTPSAVYITMPNVPSGSFYTSTLVGLMAGDPSFGVGNQWGTVISDLSNLQDWASLIGSQSQFSWINASTMCWKGTSPINLSIEFYLINYSSGLGLENKLAMLTKLAAIDQDPNASGISENFKVNVHGGYAADVLTGNQAFFSRKKDIEKFIEGKQGSALQELNQVSGRLYKDGQALGALTVTFGHKSSISNLLLSKMNITESTIEVADQNGRNIKPLYYRVNAQFTGVRPLITRDVDAMFRATSKNASNPNREVVPFVVGQGHTGG